MQDRLTNRKWVVDSSFQSQEDINYFNGPRENKIVQALQPVIQDKHVPLLDDFI